MVGLILIHLRIVIIILQNGLHQIEYLGFYISNSDGKLYWWCSHNGTQTTQTMSATNLKDGNWHFFAAMKDGNNITLYIDNLSPVTVSGTSGIYNSSVLANIGRSESGNGYDWNGNIGPIQIYNRALSASDVLQNYNAEKIGLVCNFSLLYCILTKIFNIYNKQKQPKWVIQF